MTWFEYYKSDNVLKHLIEFKNAHEINQMVCFQKLNKLSIRHHFL